MPSTRRLLEDLGFTGFVRFSELPVTAVPLEPGVYAVARPSLAAPIFLSSSCGGHFKGRDPSVPVATLRAKWVGDAQVVYVGKANPIGLVIAGIALADRGKDGKRGLRKRLDEYRRYGQGHPIAHAGGRYIWQLADSSELLVAWLPTPDQDPADVEARLLASFRRSTGALPFANLNAGRKSQRQ